MNLAYGCNKIHLVEYKLKKSIKIFRKENFHIRCPRSLNSLVSVRLLLLRMAGCLPVLFMLGSYFTVECCIIPTKSSFSYLSKKKSPHLVEMLMLKRFTSLDLSDKSCYVSLLDYFTGLILRVVKTEKCISSMNHHKYLLPGCY